MSQTYSFLDHQDIMDSLVLFMRNQDTFKDFNFDGSAIRELLRVLAFNAQQQAFYNNFVYNELQLDSAQIQSNVNSLASRIGYVPTSKTAAKIKVNLTVTPTDINTAPTTLTLSRDTTFYASNDGKAFIFSPNQIYTASLNEGVYKFNNVTLLQGTWVNSSFVVQTQYGFESYEIPNDSIDTSTLEVYVRDSETSGDIIPYNVFKTAYDLGSESQICFLRENRSGFYEIRFGDGKLANRLDYGNIITIKYLITDGVEGNNITNLSLGTSVSGYYDVIIDPVDEYSYGGADAEDIESVRNLAPLTFSTSGNAVTTGDYVSLTKKLFSEADDVISWNGGDNDPPKHGYVFVAVKPVNSEKLTDSQKTDLVNILKKYNIGSITPVITDPDYIYVNIDSNVKYDPKKQYLTEIGLTTKISDYCKNFSRNKLEKFDGELDMSKLTEFINVIDSSIVGNSTQASYERRFIPVLNILGSYVMKFYHEIKKSSIKIEGFRVADADSNGWTYSIYDNDGILVMSKTNGSNTKILQSNVGSVDYENGVVTLSKFMPNSIVDQYVSVKCESGSYDQSVSGSFNVVLKFNEINISLESIR